MPEENSNTGSGFEASPEEMAFVMKLRAATQALTPAEINLLRKRRESDQGADAGAGEGGEGITLESIKPGMTAEQANAVLRRMLQVATG